jgi:hypothetical protein
LGHWSYYRLDARGVWVVGGPLDFER